MFIRIKKLITSSTCYENLSWSRNETLEAESDQRSMGPGKDSRHSLPLGAGRGLRVGPLEGLQLSGRLSASFQQGLRADDKSGIPKASEKRGIVS